jgi:ABC-type bacteriocin/lantibiotic exporter with double-glycine peptidase domain
MLDCLKALHVPASAFKVDREDLEKVQTPAIVLWGEHYVTLLGVENRSIRVFDTLTRSERSVPIPDRDDPDFYLNVILLRGTL